MPAPPGGARIAPRGCGVDKQCSFADMMTLFGLHLILRENGGKLVFCCSLLDYAWKTDYLRMDVIIDARRGGHGTIPPLFGPVVRC